MVKVPSAKKQIKADVNPFGTPAKNPSNFVSDLTGLHVYNGNLVAGLNSVLMAREHARFLLPSEIDMFQSWATQHPTVDPRTWVPLARQGVHPESEEAAQVARADIARQVSEGSYGRTIGAPHTPPTGPKNDQPGHDVFGWLHDRTDEVYNGVKGGVRATLTAATAPYEAFWGGALRTTAGDEHKEQALISKYGLSKDEARAAFTGSGKNEPLGGPDKVQQPSDPVEARKQAAIAMIGGGAAPVWSFNEDAQKRIRAAQNEWNTTGRQAEGQSLVSTIAEQTQLGQVFKDPSILTRTTDKDGKPINQTSWLPGKEGQERSAAEAVQAYDIRTQEEKARGVAPTAWTMGRGIAHIWKSPDESGFSAISGAVDFGVNLGMDPVNLIPAGAAGKVVRAPALLARRSRLLAPATQDALKVGGKQVVVATPTARFAKGGVAGGSPIQGAREGARGSDVVARAREAGAGRIVEDRLAPFVDDETGRVASPHGNFVMAQTAWDWLNRGKGARIVDQITQETNAHKIWLASGRKMDADLAVALSRSATPEETRAILGTRMGYDIRDSSDLGSLGKSGPALFKNRALLDSAGIGTLGRKAYRQNVEAVREAGASRVGAHAAALSSVGVGVFRNAPAARTLNLEDADTTLTELDAYLRGIRMNMDDVSPYIDAIVKAPTGAHRYALIYGKDGVLNKVVKKSLLDQGLTDAHANEMTRAFEGGLSQYQRDWLNDGIADGFGSAPGNVGRSLLENEQLSKAAALPDYRTLRRTTSGLGRIMSGNGDHIEKMARASDYLQGATSAWRYSVLVRPAYMLREVGELAFSMSLGGYKGLFSHPGAFIAATHQTALSKHMTDVESRGARVLSGSPVRKAMVRSSVFLNEGLSRLHPSFDSNMARINGQGFWDEANKVIDGNSTEAAASMFDGLSSIHGNFQIDEAGSRVSAKSARALSRVDPDARDAYVMAFVDKLKRASGDRDMRNLANPDMTRQEIYEAFMASTHDIKRQMRPDLLTGTKKSQSRYLEGYRDLLQKITLGDEELMEAVRTGKFADKDLIVTGTGRNTFVPPELRKKIESMMDHEELSLQMPDVLHDFGSTYTKNRWGKKFVNDWFTSIGEWSDLFVRGPLIREAYARRVIELAPDLSPAARADAIAKLRGAKDYGLARRVAATEINRSGTLGIDEVDHIASGFARRESERLFYDAHKRQNYALAMRVVMPFAQATFNTFRRWGELSMENPQFMYRATKPVEALMDPGSAAMYDIASAMIPGDDGLDSFYTPGHPELSADGFFFTNSYGDRQFAYPLLGSLASLMPGSQGTPVALGSAESLNVAGTSLFPGVGPMVTLGEALVVPDWIYRNDAKGSVLRATNPYGLPQGSFAEKLFGTIAANWSRRLQASSDPEQAANATMKAIPGLISTGEYDMSSSSDQRRLVNDAKALSESTSLLGALGVSLTPGSFTNEFLIAAEGDKTGDVRRMMLADKLAQEYRKYTKALPGQDPLHAKEQGEAKFLEDFGQTALLSVLPRTEVDGPQATNDIWQFRSQNEDAYTENQPIIGMFFSGGDPTGDFSQNLYRWQQSTGERKPKDPNDYVHDANQTMGWMAWNAKQADIDALPADQQSTARARVRDDIEAKYPGWTGKASDLGAFDTRMNQIRDALNDPRVSSLASADYIETYIKTRDDAMKDLRDNHGVTTLDSKAAQAAGITQELFDLGRTLRQQDTSGGFTNAWTRLFSQEFSVVDNG